jgi:hypothetical protein
MIRTNFVVCIKNEGYGASLELRKLYTRIPDKQAEAQRLIRIVDESGEDYLYPESNFLPVSLSKKIKKAVAAAS